MEQESCALGNFPLSYSCRVDEPCPCVRHHAYRGRKRTPLNPGGSEPTKAELQFTHL